MKRIVIVFIGLLTFTQLHAQLLNEVGVFVGGTNYSGDIGNELFIFPNKVGWGFKYKRNANSRLSYRASYSYIPIYDHDERAFNKERNKRDYGFSNEINELALGLEFSYFDYDVMSREHGHTPYIFVELSGFYYKQPEAYNEATNTVSLKKKFSYSLPFGVGYKSRITDHLGFALEVRASYTFEDDLDYTTEKIKILDVGNPNTNDWFFVTSFSLTYSFGRPPCFFPRPF